MSTLRTSLRKLCRIDEITVSDPVASNVDNVSFGIWAKGKGLKPADVGCTSWGGSCPPDAVTMPAAEGASVGARGLYYYSNLFLHDMGLEHFKTIVKIISE